MLTMRRRAHLRLVTSFEAGDPTLTVVLSAEDLAEELGLDPHARVTCGLHRRWLHECVASPDHVIPGHDPLVMRYYPPPAPELEGIAVRLDVPPRPL